MVKIVCVIGEEAVSDSIAKVEDLSEPQRTNLLNLTFKGIKKLYELKNSLS